MSLHLTFNNMRQSEAVSAHIHDMFEELIKITDNKYPFHVRLNKEGDETYHMGISLQSPGKKHRINKTPGLEKIPKTS